MKNKENTTMKKNIKTLAALLIASATFVACSSDNDIISENQQPVNPTGKYTMTINASKGDGATTRALQPGTDSESGKNTIDAYWSGDEQIDVLSLVDYNWAQIGTATAAASSTGETTITATLTETPSTGLIFCLNGYFNDYTGQVGLLTGTDGNSISEKFDYAAGYISCDDLTIDGLNIIPNDGVKVQFESQQAIVKFTLVDKDNNAPINATSLTIHSDNQYRLYQSYNFSSGQVYGDVTINPAGTTNVIYAALAEVSNCPLTLTATVGDDTYTYEKSGVTFTHGKYYEITVKMTKI
jgi:hypothetical protein